MNEIGATKTDFPIPVDSVNPNFYLTESEIKKRGLWEYAYRYNCQRCVPAYEATRRGYLVQALPIVNKYDAIAFNPDSVWENKERLFLENSPEKPLRQNLEEQMAKWGDGARAQVFISFERDEGHTFVAEQVNGKTIYIDPQSGEENCEWYLEDARKGNLINSILRIDNNPFTSVAKECFKKA